MTIISYKTDVQLTWKESRRQWWVTVSTHSYWDGHYVNSKIRTSKPRRHD